MSCRALISELTLRQQLMMCFALSHAPALLHQHLASAALFVISAFLLPTQRRFSWISLITFIVFGVQFSVLQVLLSRDISTPLWLASTFFRNFEDLFLRTH